MPPPKPSASSSDSDSDSSEEDKPKAVAVKAKAAIAAKSPAKPVAASSDSDDSDDDSSAAVPAQTTKPKASDSSDESSDESTKAAPVKAAVKAAAGSSADSSSDSDSDEEMADAPSAVASTKRKAEDEAVAPVKKAKVDAPDVTKADEEIKTCFVGQLSWNVDDAWLKTEFETFGEVVSARVQMDRATGRSRGFGYVEFTTAASALAAVAETGKEIDGRGVKIDLSLPRAPNPEKRAKAFGDAASPPSLVLFVGNVSFDATEDAIWEAFGDHGEILSVRVPTDRDTQRPKGFAYVEFSSQDSATKAYEAMQGSELAGRALRLDYSQPRDNSGGGGGGRGGFGGRGRGGDDRGRGGFRGGRGGDRGRGGRGGDRGFGGRGRGGDRGGRGGDRGRGVRTGGAAPFEGKKITF